MRNFEVGPGSLVEGNNLGQVHPGLHLCYTQSASMEREKQHPRGRRENAKFPAYVRVCTYAQARTHAVVFSHRHTVKHVYPFISVDSIEINTQV